MRPRVFKLGKTLKIGKNIKDAVVLGWGRQILENSKLNNRNQSGNCQRLVMNVIHLKHDQFEINAVEFSDLREEASTRLSFAISSFFSKTLYSQGLQSLINLRYFKIFTGTSSIEGEPVEFPSTKVNTSQVCYSPSQMHYSHPSTFWSSLSVPSRSLIHI